MDQVSAYTLPPAQSDQSYVTVSAIEGGQITLPDHCFVYPSNADDKRTVPSLAFLIEHRGPSVFNKNASRILFDLGLRSHLGRYMTAAQAHLENNRVPYRLGPAMSTKLKAGGLETKDIDAVVLSHVHYDHH
jgi:glyoxylase-like metal-dependent hydrolase (beta-lactamase superfamily II)